jgi:serine/threonine protein kinase/roadblock/LC7 domain-containing protein
MTLTPGSRLGPYEIVATLGSGGMGEVYRARDTRLGRDIAIKVLPIDPAADQERRDRFEREARAVAALNHPNIVTIHAVEESDGVPFFTMECIEGQTLRDLIPERGLPLDQLLKIAIPLTDAVGAAHQRGILHRDLKPANVMVTAEGRVKVLDFGLAKLKEASLPAPDALQPTALATGEGRIFGTVAYMSPEQAEGKPVDQRSDVFSLGVVLFEMATGERPFKGDTSVSTISAILKDTPSSVTNLRPELPRDLGRIVKHALSKDPEHRYQTAKDLRNDLETLKEDLDSGELRVASTRPAPLVRRRPWWMWAAGVAGACALVAAGMLVSRQTKTPEPLIVPRPFADIKLTRLTSDGNAGIASAISPDGRYVAHAFIEQGRQGLRVRQVDGSATVQVVAADDVQIHGVTFTPDGNRIHYIAYKTGGGIATLYEVPVLGGTPRRLLEDIDREPSFSPDATRFAFIRGFPGKSSIILIANADGTGERTLAVRQNPTQFLLAGAQWSPDGRVIAAAAYDKPLGKVALLAISADTGAVEPIGSKRWDDVSAIRWLPAAAGLLVTADDASVNAFGQIWMVDYPGGTVRRITNDLAGYGSLDLTADARTLAATRAESRGSLWVGPAGQPDRAAHIAGTSDTVASARIRWTADGRIVYSAVVGGHYGIWTTRPDGTDVRQLTASAGTDGWASVAPDNQRVVFQSTRDGSTRIWRMDADGGRQTPLTSGPSDWNPVVAGDSKSVYYVRGDQPFQPMYRVPMDGGAPTPFLLPVQDGKPPSVPASFTPLWLSPDGTLLLAQYWNEKEGRTRVAIVAADERSVARPLNVAVELGRSDSMAWTPDGRAITFVKAAGGAPNIWRQPIDGGAPTRVTNFTAGDPIAAHAWSPDGKLLAMVRSVTARDVVVIRDLTK